MSAWRSPRRLLSCLVVVVAAFGIFDVETSSITGSLNIARSGHQATLLTDGRVLVTGGSDGEGKAIGFAEVFNPITTTWSLAAANLAPRLGHAASLLRDGRVLVVGGVPFASSCEAVESAEVYDPSTDRWSVTAKDPIPVGRGTVAVALKDGRVLISGGGTACGDVYRSAALFDPSSNTWTTTTSMEAAAQFHVATLLDDGRVIVSVGTTTGLAPPFVASVYDPTTAVWMRAPEPRPLTGTPCDGYMRTYSSALRRNSLVARATPDDCPSVTILPAGTLLIAGGISTTNAEQDSAQLSDLATGDEVPSWRMQVARAGHTATRLKNGVVLIAGGRAGAAPIASSELYIPRLPYEARMIHIVRGWQRDPSWVIGYGGFVAAATNSQGHLLIAYARSYDRDTRGNPVPHLIEWDTRRWEGDPSTWDLRWKGGPPYIRAFAPDLPELHSIRIDERGDIWGVSSTAKEIIKISAEGKVLVRFGKPEAIDGNSPLDISSAQRLQQDVENPSDVAWDRQGNVFVTDAGERPKVMKFDSRGQFLGAIGGKGSRPGSLDSPHSLATDASGNVYVADSGNARIQVFDNSLRLRAVYDNIGTPWAVCITQGARQFLYSASNRDNTHQSRRAAEIYKLELDGTILGVAVGDDPGRGNSMRIATLQHIHCREANIIVGVNERGSNLPVAITFAK